MTKLYEDLASAALAVQKYDEWTQGVGLTLGQRDALTLAQAKCMALIRTHAGEIAAMARDAERYRWLRDVGPPDPVTLYPTLMQWELVTQERNSGRLLFGHELDARIDAAIAQQSEREEDRAR
mgnify:CR=1 FL=1